MTFGKYMPEKDPLSYSLITYGWVMFLSMWGGVVSFREKVRKGVSKNFNLVELIGEISASAFVGILTFYLCEWSEINKLLEPAIIGISGHMGTRGIWMIEKILSKRIDALLSSAIEEKASK